MSVASFLRDFFRTDFSSPPPQQRRARVKKKLTQSVEILEQRTLLDADLSAAMVTGWDGPIVVSTITGTNEDTPEITPSDTIFVDYTWGNFGDTAVGGTYNVQLLLDGVEVANVVSGPNDPFTGDARVDLNIGSLALGNHTLRMIVDVNDDIAESDEGNNTFTREFEVRLAGTHDFGDAPTAAQTGFASSYATLLADGGAQHVRLSGFSLGQFNDLEGDGTPDLFAFGDDEDSSPINEPIGNPDDEDGVTFAGSFLIGQLAQFDVEVDNTAGVANPWLDAWVDFNRDGDWDDSGERIFSGLVTDGTNTITFTPPGGTESGLSYARFRLHDGTTALPVGGLAADGEVEDHVVRFASLGEWYELGPKPTQNGQLENVTPNLQVTGATHTVLAHPTIADILYIGAVNGGIWKTTNATDENPDWIPQTDFLESLSIGAMAFDYSDNSFNTLVAGTGPFSSFAGISGSVGSVYRTTDGGATWVNPGSAGLAGESITGVFANGNTIVVTSSANGGGVLRSTDGGATFVVVEDEDFVNNDNFYDLVYDNQRDFLYAAGEELGVYRSDDSGGTWTKITGPGINAEMDDLITEPANNNIEMAVAPTNGRLYVAVLNGGQPRGIFWTDNPNTATPTWTRMDVPVLPLGDATAISNVTNTSPITITSSNHGLSSFDYVAISGVAGNTAANGLWQITVTGASTFELNGSVGNGTYTGGGTWTEVTGPNPRFKDVDETGAQGRIHFSIVADPTNHQIVYVGGDRQDQPNAIGDNSFGGAIFRGDTRIAPDDSQVPSPQWDHLTHDVVAFDPDGGTANGTAPHADSREMTFDANGDLIEVDDGGVYRRTSPRDNTGDWFSLAGSLGVVEFHDIAYDNLSNTVVGGSQDNGTQYQHMLNLSVWDFLSGGDGGDVAVDNVTLAGSNQSIRYSSFQNLGAFRRTVWDDSGQLVSTSFPALTVTGGGAALIPNFVTPVLLNAVDPSRFVIHAANSVYQSTNQGNTLTEVAGGSGNGVSGLASTAVYGGFRNGVANVNVLWVASGSDVFLRTGTGALVATASDPTSSFIRSLDINPEDWGEAIITTSSGVFRTTDEGATWTEITGDLMTMTGQLFSVKYVQGGRADAIVVSGSNGIFVTSAADPGTWTRLGTALPNVIVHDLDVDTTDDVLVIGTMGRGAWILDNISVFIDDLYAPPDSIIGRNATTGEWYFNTLSDDGTTVNVTIEGGWSTTPTWVDVLTGDFDGDGREDFAGRVQANGNWWVALSSDTNRFNWGQLWTTWTQNPNITWVDVQAGDFDGDGLTDIAGRVQESGAWWIARSDGTQFINSRWTTWSTNTPWVDVTVGDFDNNGFDDIVGRSQQSGTWWAALSSSTQFTNSAWGSWSTAVTWIDVFVGDYDGDGRADMIGRSQQSGTWWAALSNGTSFDNVRWGRWATGVSWVGVVSGDFDNDGRTDIAGRIDSSDNWWVSRSSGTQFVTENWTRWGNAAWVDIVAGDFDGDGRTDIAGRVDTSDNWWVAISDGTTFTNRFWGGWPTSGVWVDIAAISAGV